jgi:hypothetical protein
MLCVLTSGCTDKINDDISNSSFDEEPTFNEFVTFNDKIILTSPDFTIVKYNVYGINETEADIDNDGVINDEDMYPFDERFSSISDVITGKWLYLTKDVAWVITFNNNSSGKLEVYQNYDFNVTSYIEIGNNTFTYNETFNENKDLILTWKRAESTSVINFNVIDSNNLIMSNEYGTEVYRKLSE